jgi:activating signal cointegrator complex subunit 3
MGSDFKGFISRVRLLVIDEVHLLGEERGAVLEAIVSRTRFISQHLTKNGAASKEQVTPVESYEMTRIIGLSTALANPADLADWLGVPTTGDGRIAQRGFYNFRPSVRPVKLKVHVQGYSGQHYCPR